MTAVVLTYLLAIAPVACYYYQSSGDNSGDSPDFVIPGLSGYIPPGSWNDQLADQSWQAAPSNKERRCDYYDGFLLPFDSSAKALSECVSYCTDSADCKYMRLTAMLVDCPANVLDCVKIMYYQCRLYRISCSDNWKEPYVWRTFDPTLSNSQCPISSMDKTGLSTLWSKTGACRLNFAANGHMISSSRRLRISNFALDLLPPHDCQDHCINDEFCNRIHIHILPRSRMFCSFYFDGCVQSTNYDIFSKEYFYLSVLQQPPKPSDKTITLLQSKCAPVLMGARTYPKVEYTRELAFAACVDDCGDLNNGCNQFYFRSDITGLTCLLYWNNCINIYGSDNSWWYVRGSLNKTADQAIMDHQLNWGDEDISFQPTEVPLPWRNQSLSGQNGLLGWNY